MEIQQNSLRMDHDKNPSFYQTLIYTYLLPFSDYLQAQFCQRIYLNDQKHFFRYQYLKICILIISIMVKEQLHHKLKELLKYDCNKYLNQFVCNQVSFSLIITISNQNQPQKIKFNPFKMYGHHLGAGMHNHNMGMMNAHNMGMMNAQMGSMNAFQMGLINQQMGTAQQGVFFYSGNCISLQSRLESIMTSMESITDASITVTGTLIKEASVGCMIATVVCGSIFIFPLCFMCCGWWKRTVSESYSIPLSTYQKLAAILQNPGIRAVTLSVVDNTFNFQKAQILFNLLAKSHIKGFSFINRAGPYDLNDSEFSDFKQNMKPIKSLSINSQLVWYDKIAL